MKIETAKFLKALEIVKPGLANKELIEQSTSFCFLDGKIITYNDEISISYAIDDLNFNGAVNAVELYAFINKIKVKEFSLELIENEIVLKAGRAKAGLTLHNKITLPIEEVGEIEKWKKLPKDFIEGIKTVVRTCSTNAADAILACVHVNKTTLESSDNYRITNYTLDKKVPVKSFLILGDTCKHLVQLNPIEISKGKGWVHFRTEESAVISCRIMEDSYVDTSDFLEMKGTDIIFPNTIINVLERAGVFSKKASANDEEIQLELSKKKLQIKSRSDSGWFEEATKIEYTGKTIQFSIAPFVLKDILTETNKGIINNNKLMFEGENWKYVTLLK